MEHSAPQLRRLLRQAANPSVRPSQQRFFREPIRSLGVRTVEIRRLAAAASREYRRAGLSWSEILHIAERLWQGRWYEERVLAVLILSRFPSRLGSADWARFDQWIERLSNWAETDTLCIYLLAPILQREPKLAGKLRPWTRSANRWRRRAAAVALAPLARRGQHLDVAFKICDRLAADRDDLVEKAVGWLLKEASRTQPQTVAEYLAKNSKRLSRTSLRHACEKLPRKLRSRVLGY